MRLVFFMFKGFFVANFREKGKKRVFACILLMFLSIFAPKNFPLPKK